MTPEELDEARAKEAVNRWKGTAAASSAAPSTLLATIAARLAREGWTPPEPVDPDLMAFREWAERTYSDSANAIRGGDWDNCGAAIAFKAGAKWATDRSNRRINDLTEALDEYGDWENHDADLHSVLSVVGEGRL